MESRNGEEDFFEKLPPEITSLIVEHVNTDKTAQRVVPQINRGFYSLFQADRLANRALLAALRFEMPLLITMLRSHPNLLFKKAAATNLLGYSFARTPADYLFSRQDWRTLYAALPYLSLLDEHDSIKLNDFFKRINTDNHSSYRNFYNQYLENCEPPFLYTAARQELIHQINQADPYENAVRLRMLSLEYIDCFNEWEENKREEVRQVIINLQRNIGKTDCTFDIIPFLEANYKYLAQFPYHPYIFPEIEQRTKFYTQVIVFFKQHLPWHYTYQQYYRATSKDEDLRLLMRPETKDIPRHPYALTASDISFKNSNLFELQNYYIQSTVSNLVGFYRQGIQKIGALPQAYQLLSNLNQENVERHLDGSLHHDAHPRSLP